jgi:hypothetical protein
MNRGTIVDRRVSRKAVWGGELGRLAPLPAILALTMASASCGDLTRQGTGSSYLIIAALQGASGAEPGTLTSTLNSDVITIVDDVPTIFNDLGQVTLSLQMKDPTSATGPTSANFITINRYRVRYSRSDGRNTPGVDVPYGFDGALTGTVTDTDFSAGFELVRHIAKSEAPLQALAASRVIISTIAEITFYGHDQTGRDVSVTGQMLVSFGNFGDPD